MHVTLHKVVHTDLAPPDNDHSPATPHEVMHIDFAPLDVAHLHTTPNPNEVADVDLAKVRVGILVTVRKSILSHMYKLETKGFEIELLNMAYFNINLLQ